VDSRPKIRQGLKKIDTSFNLLMHYRHTCFVVLGHQKKVWESYDFQPGKNRARVENPYKFVGTFSV